MRLVEHREKWAVRIDGKRLSTGYAATPENRASAERTAREILNARAQALSGENCLEIVDAYFADMPNRANAKVVSEPYRYAAQAVLGFFSEHTPDDVTRDECRAYIAHRRSMGRADGTIRKELDVLRAALNWKSKRTPAEFDFPAPAPPRDRYLDRSEFDRLLDAATFAHIKTFLHIAIVTGARKEAILSMQWETHVNFDRRTLWTGFKPGGKNRSMPLPMTDDAMRWLSEARRGAQSAWVCEWAGERVINNKKALKATYERAGIADVAAPAHVLRHTAGAWMAIAGVPLLEIARRLGHTSIRTTERHYAHLHPDHMSASTAALEITKVLPGSIEPSAVTEPRTKVPKRIKVSAT